MAAGGKGRPAGARGRGRPSLGELARHATLTIRLSAEELAAVESVAIAAGVSPRVWVRDLVLEALALQRPVTG